MRRLLPALVASRIFQDWVGWSDCTLGEVDVEPQEVVVFNGLKFHGVTKEIVVGEGLDRWM